MLDFYFIYSVNGTWQTQNNIGVLFITYVKHVPQHISCSNLPTTLQQMHQPDAGHPPEARAQTHLPSPSSLPHALAAGCWHGVLPQIAQAEGQTPGVTEGPDLLKKFTGSVQ